jgi:uncharacterized YigZ family protein
VEFNIEEDKYTTIRGVYKTELRVKKSRFIGLAKSVATELEAMDFVDSVRSEFPDATHHCYAFIIGAGARQIARSNDAGEPINSAGKPILTAIEASGLQNVICVVVRYFGGVKLGIGGLIRAYGQTARECLENAEKTVYIPTARLQIDMTYEHIGAVLNLVSRLKGNILDVNQSEKVEALVCLKRSMVASLKEGIKSISDVDILVKEILK